MTNEQLSSLWVSYLKSTEHYESYVGDCECETCANTRRGYPHWLEERLRTAQSALAQREDQLRQAIHELNGAIDGRAHFAEALELTEKASGFVPGDEPLWMWVSRMKHERDEAQAACAEMRERLTARVEFCCTPDGSLDGGFKYCDHCRKDLHALSSDCGKDFLAALEEIASHLHLSGECEKIAQKVLGI